MLKKLKESAEMSKLSKEHIQFSRGATLYFFSLQVNAANSKASKSKNCVGRTNMWCWDFQQTVVR